MEGCIFCGIVAGTQPAQIVDQDEHTVAFMDINPWARGHALVVPRRHARNLYDIEPDELGHVVVAGRRLAQRMRDELGCEDVHLFNSAEPAAGQVVMHFHLHVVPGDGSEPEWPARPESRPDAAELERIADALRG